MTLDIHETTLSQVLQQRRATSHFTSLPVPNEELRSVVEAGLAAPSGYNLQPWRFLVVRDPETRARLREAAFGQPKVEEAPVVVVACGDPEAWVEGDLDAMLRMAADHHYGGAKEHAQVVKGVHGLLDAPGDIGGIGPDRAVWVNRQVMIAFTHMMLMAEAMGFDTAPMEGFSEKAVREVLGIPDRVRVVALLAIGHKRGEDKPYGGRFDTAKLVFGERWGQPADLWS